MIGLLRAASLLSLGAPLDPAARPDLGCESALEGDSVAVQQLEEILRARGADCRGLSVSVFSVPSGLLLVILDAGRSPIERRVSTPEVAARLVESWASEALPPDLLAPPDRNQRVKTRQVVKESQRPLTASSPTPAATIEEDRALLRLAIFGEAGLADDGSWWGGASASADLDLVKLRPFVRARISTNPEHQDVSFRTPVSRTGFELLTGVLLPIELGRVHLTPGLALGAGFIDTVRADPDRSQLCEPGTACEPVANDGFESTHLSLRAEASLEAGLELLGWCWLGANLSFSVDPFADTDPIAPKYASELAPAQADRLALAGEPTWLFRMGLGLSVLP